jgi:hypothetical protein
VAEPRRAAKDVQTMFVETGDVIGVATQEAA